MSRRKQSNPKPLKRKTEDTLEEVAELLHLPRDLFSVKDPEDDVHEYTVFTRRRLHEGLCFGPYGGHVIQQEEEKVLDDSLHVIETKDPDGRRVRFALRDDSGGWLKLLKPSCDRCNAALLHNESVVWCTITTDIEADTELLVSHRWRDDVAPPSRGGSRPHHSSRHLLKARSRRPKGRNPFRREGDEQEEQPSSDCFGFQGRKSPDYSGENDGVFNGRLPGEALVEFEPGSPVSLPNSSPPPPVPKNGDSSTEGGMCIPYLNGCSYLPAFPYGKLVASPATEGGGPFKCETCEVSFSSRRVLESHKSNYCPQVKPASAAAASSDTDTEDNAKTDSTAFVSPAPSEDGDNQLSKDPLVSKRANHPQTHEESSALTKRRRASLNELPPGNARSSRPFRCPCCSYTSDKKASLTRHLRMHGGEGLCEVTPLATPPMARYCANCDIQFASFKNYQVHKEYYCNTRHVHKSVTSSPNPSQQQNSQQQPQQQQLSQPRSPENPTAQQESASKGYNMVINQPLYAAISTSPLILVPCSYVAGGGLSPAAGLIPAGNIIIPNPAGSPEVGSGDSQGANVIPTYTVMPGAASDLNASSPPVSPEDNSKDEPKLSKQPPKEKISNVPSPKDSTSREDPEKPLDLSFKKREPETHRSSITKSVPPEAGVPSTSYQSVMSPAEDSGLSVPPAPTLPIIPLLNPNLDLNLIGNRPQLQALEGPVLASPQVLVKQGTSKCKECNIVFYKHENYLVHKNKYCAARGQNSKRDSTSPERIKPDDVDSSDREDTGRSTQKSPVSSPRMSNSRTPPMAEGDSSEATTLSQHSAAMLQYYCIACGIKYTSIDNLRAHQLYYCPKRDLSSPMALMPSYQRNSQSEFKCGKCKNAYPTEELLRQHPCVVQRKCPYCDVYCPTLSAAQRHLVTHTGIKSFRCSLCGYKGHTLRGMRTHIRIHLDKNSSTPEEAYILCMDEGGAEIGCAGRKSSGGRMNSDRIKSVIATEPPHGETSLAVSPISGTTQTVAPSDVVAIKAVTEDPVATGDTTHWCQICGYSSSYKGNVVRHVKLVHKDLVSTQTMSNIVNSRPSVESVMKQSEPVEHVSRGTPQDAIMNPSTDHSNSSSSLDVKPMINGILSKPELRLEEKPLMLKTEAVSPPPPSSGSTPTKGTKRPLSEEGQCPVGGFSSKTGPKYCKSCDISFNYLSNFLAHKKFYCTPRPGEVAGQESTSVQSVQ